MEENKNLPGEDLQEQVVENKEAEILIEVSNDQMEAVAFVVPPTGNGNHLSEDALKRAIAAHKITHGLNQENIELLLKPTYSQKIVIASGVYPEHGTNGVCEELFARERERTYAMREDGTKDYKESNYILDIEKGTPICKITKPTQGTDGMDIKGRQLKAVAGSPAKIPLGEGTRISHDGDFLEAAQRGNLEFKVDSFKVSKLVRVNKVNLDTGNIKFSGDVHVVEEVSDGFKIKAGGNVRLDGYVGACTVIAGGDIILQKGINGTGRGVLEAGKSIATGYIENATVSAQEKISAKFIINSDVNCEGQIDITQGKGLICGGTISCFGNVTANIIGNEQNTATTFRLGITAGMRKEKQKIETDIKAIETNIEEMTKNISYINQLVELGKKIPQERTAMLQKTKLALPMSQKKLEKLQENLAEIEEKMSEVPKSILAAREIFPPTTIFIGALRYNVGTKFNSTRFYCGAEGGIVTGPK